DEHLTADACRSLKCEPGLPSIVAHANGKVLFAITLLYLSSVFAWSLRWKTLLGIARVPVPLLAVARITFEAQAGGILLPGGVGGDALRIASMVERGVRLPVVLASVLLDRALGLATVAGISVAIAVVLDPHEVGPLTLFVGALPVGLVVGL